MTVILDREKRIQAAVAAWGNRKGKIDPVTKIRPGTPDAIISAYWDRYGVEHRLRLGNGNTVSVLMAGTNRAAIEGYHYEMAEVADRVNALTGPHCQTCDGPIPVRPGSGGQKLYCCDACKPGNVNAPHPSGAMKVCEICDGEYVRMTLESQADWDSRRFCGPECGRLGQRPGRRPQIETRAA